MKISREKFDYLVESSKKRPESHKDAVEHILDSLDIEVEPEQIIEGLTHGKWQLTTDYPVTQESRYRIFVANQCIADNIYNHLDAKVLTRSKELVEVIVEFMQDFQDTQIMYGAQEYAIKQILLAMGVKEEKLGGSHEK